MRDIKFRAWHPEWSDMILGYDKPIRFDKREFYPFEFAVGFSHYPEDDRWVLMQFTGLKDKNGKEIYEGDIIEGPNRKHWIIKWKDYSWCVDNHDLREIGVNKFAGDESYPLHKYLSFQKSLKNSLIIIGNIYENPELLKVDNS